MVKSSPKVTFFSIPGVVLVPLSRTRLPLSGMIRFIIKLLALVMILGGLRKEIFKGSSLWQIARILSNA